MENFATLYINKRTTVYPVFTWEKVLFGEWQTQEGNLYFTVVTLGLRRHPNPAGRLQCLLLPVVLNALCTTEVCMVSDHFFLLELHHLETHKLEQCNATDKPQDPPLDLEKAFCGAQPPARYPLNAKMHA